MSAAVFSACGVSAAHSRLWNQDNSKRWNQKTLAGNIERPDAVKAMKDSERERGGKKALMEKQNIFPTCMKTRSVNTSKNTHEHLLSNYRLLCVIMKDSRLARTQTPQRDDLVSTAPESFFPQMLGFMHTWIKTCLSLWWGGNLTRSFFSFHHLSTFTLLTGVTSGMWMSQIQTAHTFHSCCVKCKMAPGSWYRWQNH